MMLFNTQFGKELKRLCDALVSCHGMDGTGLIDLYFGAMHGLAVPWLDGADGSLDVLDVVRQRCESEGIHDLVDYLYSTIPVLVQDERLFKALCRSTDPQMLIYIIHCLFHLCRQDTSFVKTLLDGSGKAVEQMKSFFNNRGVSCPLDCSLATQVLRAMLAVPTKTEFRTVSEDRRSMKDLQSLYDLDNVLNMPRIKQWEICNRIISKSESGVHIGSIVEEFGKGFTSNISDQEVTDSYNRIVTAVLRSSPLDVACKLYLGKKTSFVDVNGKTKQTVSVERDNDVLLETGFVRILFSSLVKDTSEKGRVLVLFPSPFFIREWFFDDNLLDRSVDFVIENSDYKELMIRHFTDSNYFAGPCDYFTFYTLYEWLAVSDGQCGAYSDVLVIEKDGFAYDKLATAIKAFNGNVNVYSLSPDSSFSDFGSFAYELGHGEVYGFDDLLLIPKGRVADSTSAIKCFWHASKRSADYDSKTYILRAVQIQNSIVLTPGSFERVCIDDFVCGGFNERHKSGTSMSLRTYISERLKNKKNAKNRDNAVPVRFSRELTIWYSLSQSSRNPEKVRPCVYFKTAYHDGKAPVQLKSSVRLCHEMYPDDVPGFVRDVYPYAPFKKGNDKIVPQDCAIAEYAELYNGHSVSLKTALFLHPEWKEAVTATVWNQLVALSSDGLTSSSAMDELSEEDYCERIAAVFPGKRDSVISSIVIGLSKIIQKAIEIGYASRNPVSELAIKSGKSERAFLIMRQNLSKKTFTKKEFSELYNNLLSRVENAETNGKGLLIGALIRLLTGIESNVLCALTWDDFSYLEDYGIYVFQLYRQVPNGGGPPKLIESDTGFRCIPCPPHLAGVVLEWRKCFYDKFSPENVSMLPILSNPLTLKSVISNIRPYDLEKELRAMVSALGLPEDIVTLPDIDGDMKDSNINIFQGDLFRENFRFWASMHAGFTADEVCYCLGNLPETIFSINYCDFLNEGAQFVLYIKFRRLEAILRAEDGGKKHRHMDIEDHGSHLIEAFGSAPLQIEIEAEPDEEGKLVIAFESSDMLLNAQEEDGLSSHLEYAIKGDFEYVGSK